MLVLMACLSSSQIQKSTIPSGTIPLLALLVTPAHIKLLDFDEGFIPSILRQVFQIPNDGQQIDVVAAVVDRIPYPSSSKQAQQIDNRAIAVTPTPEILVEDGSEGLSFVVLDSKGADPDLWSAREEVVERETMTIQQRCTLSFEFPPTAITIPLIPAGKEKSQPVATRVVRLPVANTLFHNGTTSTLFAQRWRSQQSSESSVALILTKETALPQQTLLLASAFSNQSVVLDQSLHSYLMPITPTRTITAAIGNIIRRINVASTSDEGVPASEELEKAISVGIQEGRISARQAGIWALVRPPNHDAPDRPESNLKDSVHDEIQQAVLNGCQLHKVLSGGGGWGEKHGLLALDPDCDYNTSPQTFEASFEIDQDIEIEKLQALGEIVKPGDTVKFYVCRNPNTSKFANDSASDNQSMETTTPISMQFGSLPSSMDAMPNVSSAETNASSHSTCTIFKSCFGMLSEQGMSLQSAFMKTDLHASKARSFRPGLPEHGLPPYGVLDQPISTTKLDAPYTVFSVKEKIDNLDAYNTLSGERAQRPNSELQGTNLRKSTESKNTNARLKNKQSINIDPLVLDEFVEALSSMPPHQAMSSQNSRRMETARSARPKARRIIEAKGENRNKTLMINREAAALRRLHAGFPMIRKHDKPGPEEGIQNVPLLDLKRVQSSIANWESKNGGENIIRENPKYHDASEVSRQAVPPAIPNVDSGLRIRKHEARLPTLVDRKLSSSVRASVLEAWRSAKQTPAKTDPDPLEFKFLFDDSKERMRSMKQSKDLKTMVESRTESVEQPETSEQIHVLSGRVVRRTRVREASNFKVRRYIGLSRLSKLRLDEGSELNWDDYKSYFERRRRNYDMAAKRVDGHFERKKRQFGKKVNPEEKNAVRTASQPNKIRKDGPLDQEYRLPFLDEYLRDLPRA